MSSQQQQQGPSVHSSAATELSLRPGNGGPSSSAQAPALRPPPLNVSQSPEPLGHMRAGPSGGEGPPQSAKAADNIHPRDARTARRRLNVAQSVTSLENQAQPQDALLASPSVGNSDLTRHGRMSRLAQKALLRGSVRDSGSERSSRAVVKDVYRDDRGRRIERPKTVKSDIHVIGEIVGASGFPGRKPALSCRYRLVYDGVQSWTVVQGHESGATQVSSSGCGEDDLIAWEHPIDMHLTTQKLEAWPSLLLMVYRHDDSADKDCFHSYALCPLPNTPGLHTITLRTWYPAEARKLNARSVFAHYVGIEPRLDDDLTDTGFATDVAARQDAGPYIASVGSGCVHLRLQMLFRHLTDLTRQMGDPLYKSLGNFKLHLDEGRKKEENRAAALAEHQANKAHSGVSAGLRQIQEGRGAIFQAAQRALDQRRSASASRDRSVTDQSRAGSFVRGNGVQSAPRQRRESNAAGGGLASSVDAAPWQRRSAGEPVWSSRAPLGTPDSAGRSPGLGGPPPSDTPSDQLGRRQAERERRRMGYNA